MTLREQNSSGTVVTFYSFKGGVGRSMALANIAVLLARSGRSVLCIDWDLEAPGLDRYLRAVPRSASSSTLTFSSPAKQGGLLALLEESLPGLPAHWQDYVGSRLGKDKTKIDVIGAGEDDENYAWKLSQFSWAKFFSEGKGAEIVESLRDAWKEQYDFVLIDSRTGLTDSSGVCTIQMPDLAVILFAANYQNIEWSLRVVHGIREGRKRLPYDRTFLPIIPVLARFDAREESDRADEALNRIAMVFRPFFEDWLPRSISPREMLAWSVLPYVPRYNFEEALAVDDEPETGPQGLSYYYQLLSRLIDGGLKKVRPILASVGVSGAALPPLLPSPQELDAELRHDPLAIQRYLTTIKERAEEEPIEAARALEAVAAACVTISRFQDAEALVTEAISLLSDPSVARTDEISRLKRKRAELSATFAGATKRFRVAFSFAGPQRDFVDKVASRLSDRFGKDRILYDRFHEAEFARSDLAFRLPDLYELESDLIVAIITPDYDRKEWCGLEWRAILSIIKGGSSERVLLSRFSHTDEQGLFSLAGFIELDDKTPEQFAKLILERLALNEGLPKDHYTKPVFASGDTPRTSIPHNLPSLQPFFGREEELRKIADALDPESRTWGALIDGAGGMGKTSLAVRAAYDVPAEAFERIAFVSLKSRELDDDGLRDLSGFLISGLAELLNELARELGRDDIAKAVENERPRMLLDALRGTKTLLILDNLESLLKRERDMVFTFVKKLPPGCKAILTSRGRIGSGAEELILDKLSEDAALATIAKLAETNPALAQTSEAERLTLCRETGGKPLLLRWTAGQIGRGSCVTFTDAIHYLRSCPEGNDPLEFIFGDLVEDFSEAETRTLCALTYFTLPAKIEHIITIAERDETETEQALKSLINRSLVVPSQELKTFTLVPLVADFLRVKKPEVLQETGDRLEKHAYALVVENGYDNHDRFPVLDAAWPTISAALPRFLAGENERLQTVCSALTAFLNFTGRWDELLAVSRDAESRAVAEGDVYDAGWRAYHAGSVHYLRQQSAEVLACADRADAHWRESKAGARERATAMRLRGFGHELAKDYSAAIASYREAVELDRTLGHESIDVTTSLNDLANAEQHSGDLDGAERDYREALRIARGMDDREGVAIYTGNLASLALNRKDWPGAEALASEALPLAERVGRQELIASNSCRIAEALGRQGKKEEALPYARRAVEIFQKLGSPKLATAQQILTECES